MLTVLELGKKKTLKIIKTVVKCDRENHIGFGGDLGQVSASGGRGGAGGEDRVG